MGSRKTAKRSARTRKDDERRGIGFRQAVAAVHGAVVKMPAALRYPLVIYHIEGKTKQQTAQQLGLTLRTLTGRLARGKKLLDAKLKRRGFEGSYLLMLYPLIGGADNELPRGCARATTKKAISALKESARGELPRH